RLRFLYDWRRGSSPGGCKASVHTRSGEPGRHGWTIRCQRTKSDGKVKRWGALDGRGVGGRCPGTHRVTFPRKVPAARSRLIDVSTGTLRRSNEARHRRHQHQSQKTSPQPRMPVELQIAFSVAIFFGFSLTLIVVNMFAASYCPIDKDAP